MSILKNNASRLEFVEYLPEVGSSVLTYARDLERERQRLLKCLEVNEDLMLAHEKCITGSSENQWTPAEVNVAKLQCTPALEPTPDAIHTLVCRHFDLTANESASAIKFAAINLKIYSKN